MRISDWSSDVCSSDLFAVVGAADEQIAAPVGEARAVRRAERQLLSVALRGDAGAGAQGQAALVLLGDDVDDAGDGVGAIDRRGATGDDLDSVDEIARDRRQTDAVADSRPGHGAPSVARSEERRVGIA